MPLSDYLRTILSTCNIYNENYIQDYLKKLVNLNDRKYLPENLKNCLIIIDKKHLPEIIKLKEYEINRYDKNKEYAKTEQCKIEYNMFIKNDLQPLLDIYEFEKEQVYKSSYYGKLIKNYYYIKYFIILLMIIFIYYNYYNNSNNLYKYSYQKNLQPINDKLSIKNEIDDIKKILEKLLIKL